MAERPGTAGALWRALSVHGGEQRLVMLTGALFFLSFAGASIGLNVADALFFVRFGVESLPWMILISGGTVMVATIAYAAGLAALGPRLWSWVLLVGFGAWVLLERVSVGLELPGIYPVVWQWGQIIIYVSITLLWDVAGELCDARQAKRLFPLFASAGIAGAVTGNALTGPLASLLGTENLLVVQALASVAAGAMGWLVTRRFMQRSRHEPEPIVDNLRAGYRITVRTPLFRLLAGVAAAMSVLFFMVFMPFSEVVADSFDSEAALAGFLGTFSSLATAATFVVSLLVANRLFARIGVIAVLGIVAVVYVAGFAAWIVSFGLVTATLFRGAQWVAINALGGTAFSSVFNVLVGSARSQARDFVSAVPMQLGTVLGGALLLLGSGVSETVRFVLSLGVAAVFLAVVLRMRRAYAEALVDAVRRGVADVFTAGTTGMQKPHFDADAVAALAMALQEDDAKRRAIAAAILGTIGGQEAVAALRPLSGDPDASVRMAGLNALNELGCPPEELVPFLDDPASDVRRRAIEVIGRSGATAIDFRPALGDEAPLVRATAACFAPIDPARSTVAALMAGTDADALAAGLVAVADRPEVFDGDLTPYAAHRDRRVRAAAAAALRHRPDDAAVLAVLLDDRSRTVRCAAGTALAAQPGSEQMLEGLLAEGSLQAQEAIIEGLIDARAGDPAAEALLADWARERLERVKVVHRYREILAADRERGSTTGEYLVRLLESRERRLEEWILTALGTEETRGVVPLVVRGAITGDADTRSEALEALESMGDRRQVRPLIAFLEEHEPEATGDRHRTLRELTHDPNNWIRAVAARCLAEELRDDLADLESRAAADAEAIVREAVPRMHIQMEGAETLSLFDMVLALQRAALFSELDPEDLASLAEICHQRRFAPGDVVYEQGAPGDEMIVVVTGSAVIVADDGGSIATSGQGEPVGELSLLRRQPRMARVVAGEEGLVAIAIEGQAFMMLVEEHPRIAMALMSTLADRIAAAVDDYGVEPMAAVAT